MLKNTKYFYPDLLNKEISIDIDLSEIHCVMNSAVYLINMESTDFDILGVGYGDVQCLKDIKYFQDGKVNKLNAARCENEIVLIEANREAMAWTLHPCLNNICDASGADANSYR